MSLGIGIVGMHKAVHAKQSGGTMHTCLLLGAGCTQVGRYVAVHDQCWPAADAIADAAALVAAQTEYAVLPAVAASSVEHSGMAAVGYGRSQPEAFWRSCCSRGCNLGCYALMPSM